jgi:tetratricopeptide (TPR) repeat protein
MGDEGEALNRFQSLRAKYPDSNLTPEILWWLGAYYYRRENLDLARRYFETIIKDFPKDNLVADAYYALGSICEEENNYPEAIDKFKKVIEAAEPDLAGQATVAIADIFMKRNELDSAIKTYEQACQNYPNLTVLLYPKIADIYKLQGKYEEAIAFYHKGLALSSIKQMNTLQFKIAECFQEQAKLDEAIEEYLKIMYLYPQDKSLVTKALIRAAQIYEDKGRFKEAVDVYRKVISLDVEEAKYAQERMDWIKTHVK